MIMKHRYYIMNAKLKNISHRITKNNLQCQPDQNILI